MVRQAIQPLGEARQDWQITAEIAKRMSGCVEILPQVDVDAPLARWNYTSSSDIMTEINALAPSYAGVTHDRLEKGEQLQWPVPNLNIRARRSCTPKDSRVARANSCRSTSSLRRAAGR